MSFWNKLGKIALQAAPYVAAPFTGGASLLAAPAANKLGQKWAESDANKAAEKGLAPSKFDKYLGMASSGANMATGIGAFGKALGGAGKVGTGVGAGAAKSSIASVPTGAGGGWASKLGDLAGKFGGGNSGGGGGGGGWEQMLQQVMASRNPSAGTPPFVESPQSPISPSASFEQLQGGQGRTAQGPVMPRGGYDYDNNPMNQLNQNTPNLAQSIFQGRQDGMRDQYMSPPMDESAPAPTYDQLTPQVQPEMRKRSPGAFQW